MRGEAGGGVPGQAALDALLLGDGLLEDVLAEDALSAEDPEVVELVELPDEASFLGVSFALDESELDESPLEDPESVEPESDEPLVEAVFSEERPLADDPWSFL